MFIATLYKDAITSYISNRTNSSSINPDEELSSNISNLDNELASIINENGPLLRYSNPIMMLINPNITEDELIDTVTKEQYVLELSEITAYLNISTIIVYDIRLWDDVSVEKIDQHDVNECVALHIFNTENIHINSIRMLHFLGSLLQKYDSITLIKAGSSSPTQLSYFIILGPIAKLADSPEQNINTCGTYIDFLYAIYEYAIYIMDVIVSMHYGLKYSDLLSIKCNYDEMYKLFIVKLKMIISRLRNHTE